MRTVSLHKEMAEWRHEFHSRPGIRFDVGETAQRVASLLSSFGLEVDTKVGTSGVVGVLRKGASAGGIGLRADMDALPIQTQNEAEYRSQIAGLHHGCGHDGHTAMLLGAARQLASDGDFDGSVHFIFQPNEEEGLGAQAMIDDGLFDRWTIDEVYGLHCVPGIPTGHFALRPGPIMAFEDNFAIRLTGKGGHSSAPHQAQDPMAAGAELVTALQTIVSRSLSPSQNGVISVTQFETDGARNVLPGSVVIRGDTRGFDPKTQELIERRIIEIVKGVGVAHGLGTDVVYSHEFVVTVNTPDETRFAVETARSVVGDVAVDDDCLPNTGSEDFAKMLQQRPGCYAFIGNGIEGSHGLPWHHPGFDFNDEVLPIGADYWVTLTESRLRPN